MCVMTKSQLIRSGREKKKRFCRVKALEGCPQKYGVCRKVFVMKPKKPHSAIRKVAKVQLRSTGREVLVAIPGLGHSLQRFSKIYIRGGRVRDLPYVHYKMIRGMGDFKMVERFDRSRSRSCYGLKTKGHRRGRCGGRQFR